MINSGEIKIPNVEAYTISIENENKIDDKREIEGYLQEIYSTIFIYSLLKERESIVESIQKKICYKEINLILKMSECTGYAIQSADFFEQETIKLFYRKINQIQGIKLISPIDMQRFNDKYNRKKIKSDEGNTSDEGNIINILRNLLGLYIPEANKYIDLYPKLKFTSGKWILICPDNIRKTSEILYNGIQDDLIKKYVKIEEFTSILMKFVLYHELGHSVFESEKKHIKICSSENEETFVYPDEIVTPDKEYEANLFAAHWLNNKELAIMEYISLDLFDPIDRSLLSKHVHHKQFAMINELSRKEIMLDGNQPIDRV